MDILNSFTFSSLRSSLSKVILASCFLHLLCSCSFFLLASLMLFIINLVSSLSFLPTIPCFHFWCLAVVRCQLKVVCILKNCQKLHYSVCQEMSVLFFMDLECHMAAEVSFVLVCPPWHCQHLLFKISLWKSWRRLFPSRLFGLARVLLDVVMFLA